MPNKNTDSGFPLLTRRDAVALIRAEIGVPIPQSRFEKDAVAGRAPMPAAVYGRTHLYRRDAILEYAVTLIRPANTEAA